MYDDAGGTRSATSRHDDLRARGSNAFEVVNLTRAYTAAAQGGELIPGHAELCRRASAKDTERTDTEMRKDRERRSMGHPILPTRIHGPMKTCSTGGRGSEEKVLLEIGRP